MTLGFFAVIEIRGVNPFISVSAARARALKPGWRKPLPVLVRINRKPVQLRRELNMISRRATGVFIYT